MNAVEGITVKDVETPAAKGRLLLGQGLSGFAAKLGVRLLRKPLRLRSTVIVATHADVTEVLRRDLDFLIAPINAERINEVNGPFVLGMDRSFTLTDERMALYAALAAVDLPAVNEESAAEADRLLADATMEIDAVAGYARRVAGKTARQIFGLHKPEEALFLEVVRAIFAHTFLNVGNDAAIRERALKASQLMRHWFTVEIAERQASGAFGKDMMGAMLTQGAMDADGIRRTLGGMLVGSIDTTASAVAKILVVLSRDKALMRTVSADAQDMTRMLGWCREALRRWPHNPILTRSAAASTTLNGRGIPAGANVIVWTQAAMQDAAAFPEPDVLRPDRSARSYLHFGSELHHCAGRMVNEKQLPMLVGKLLERGISKTGSIRWAGPFPDRLPLTLGRS